MLSLYSASSFTGVVGFAKRLYYSPTFFTLKYFHKIDFYWFFLPHKVL